MFEPGQTHTEFRRRTEDALRLSEATKSAILESALDCIITIDHTGLVLDFNPAAERTFGFSREEAIGTEMAELIIPPQLRDRHRQGINRAVTSGEDRILGRRIEITAQRKNGEQFPVELAITRIVTGGPPIFTGHIRDITDRKLADQKLRESQEFFASVARNVSEAIFRRSPEEGLLFVNDEYIRMFGYQSAEELQAVAPESLYARPDQRARILALMEKQGGFRNQEVEYRRQDGTRFWGLTSAASIRDPGTARLLYFDGAIVDITERKNAEQRQAAQYSVTRVLAEAANLQEAAPAILQVVCERLQWDVGVLWRVDGEAQTLRFVDLWHAPGLPVDAFLAATRAATFDRLQGLPGRIWTNRRPEWVPDVTRDANFPRAKAAVQTGLHGAFAFPIRVKQEILGVIEFFSREIREPNAEILEMFSTIGSQIGQFIQRRTAEQGIRQLNADLERRVMDATTELRDALEREKEYSRLKSNFVTLVSHEFRTPLGVILSSAEILEAYFEKLKPEQRTEHLHDVQASAKHMAELMEQVLLLGRVEAGRVEYRPEPLPLLDLCKKLVEEILTATHQNCPIEFSSSRLPPKAVGDSSLFRHIVTNLLSNAVKYSQPGQTVEFAIERKKQHALIRVSDRGIGIPEADLKRLFESFYRASNVGQIPGTGLGMVLVKRCVDLHHGQIEVKSKQGQGTTVTVTLPLFKK